MKIILIGWNLFETPTLGVLSLRLYKFKVKFSQKIAIDTANDPPRIYKRASEKQAIEKDSHWVPLGAVGC